MKTSSTALRVLWNHLKSVWWLRILAVVIIAIIIFAVLIQVFRSSETSPDNLADIIYNFFNNWSLVFSAFVTLLLASAAFLAILDNRNTRLLDRQERRLKEIIDWANQILKCGRDIDWIRTTQLSTTGSSTEAFAAFNTILWDGVYIRNIAARIDNTLHRTILDTQELIRRHLKILNLHREGKIKHTSSIGRHRVIMDDCAKAAIFRAVTLLSPA